MQVNFRPLSCVSAIKNNKHYVSYPNLSPLKKDTVSFTSMKKSQFSGIDLAVVNKFQAPIEKFNTNQDLQNWCKDRIDEIITKDYKGRQAETIIQRKATLKDWSDYVLNENNAYSNSIALLILDGITKDLKEDDDKEIPALNKRILADTISEISEALKQNPNIQIGFNKSYRINLQKVSLGDLENNLNSNQTGWIIIPSYKHDPDNFSENVDKLKTLSHNNWCTKSFNAEPYLKKGDFHIYLDNGKSRLGVRFAGNEIEEIQGPRNNTRIPLKYLDIAKEHTKDYWLSQKTKEEFKCAEIVKKEIEQLKQKFGCEPKDCTPEQIFEAVGIEYERDKEGLLTISEYKQPSENFTFEDIGVDENKLCKNIKEIKGNADFASSQIKDLSNLQSIGKSADFRYSQIQDLSNLKSIGRDADFSGSRVKDLSSLESIGENAYFCGSQVEDLSSLQSIGENADFEDSQVKDLGNLQSIGGNTYFQNSQVQDLSSLQTIGGNAYFKGSQVQDLSSLQTIGGNADFRDSQVKNLSSLKSIGGNCYLTGSKLKKEDLENITKGEVTKKSLLSNVLSYLKKLF